MVGWDQGRLGQTPLLTAQSGGEWGFMLGFLRLDQEGLGGRGARGCLSGAEEPGWKGFV